jgi:phosphate transport system substrate-binding protein
MKKTGLLTALLLMMCNFVIGSNESANKICVSGTGDSQYLMQAIAKAFEAKYPGSQIEIPDAVGSSAGIKAVLAGNAEIARVARPLKDDEKKAGLTQQLFANTPVVFVIRPDTNGIDNITTQQVLDIYSGKIINWKQLNASEGKIYPLGREQGDSAFRILNEKMAGFADVNNPKAKIIYLTPEVVTALQEHKQTIAYVPLSAIVNTKLKVLKIDGVEPSNEKILNGEYKYLIPLGIVYKGHPEGVVKQFIDFLYTEEAAEIIKNMGAVPIKNK